MRPVVAFALAALSAPALANPVPADPLDVPALADRRSEATAPAGQVVFDCTFHVSPQDGDWPDTLVVRFDLAAQVVEIEAGRQTFRFAADPPAGYSFTLVALDGWYHGEGHGPGALQHYVILTPAGLLGWIALDETSEASSQWRCASAL